jgi:hypothetical protein
VDNNGLVTALADGEATITVTTQNGNKKATCAVNVDYRNKWVGDWDFTTTSAIGYLNGYFEWDFTYDTVNFAGIIERYGKDRLKITFKPNDKEPDFTGKFFPVQINGLIYPRICNFGYIDYPEYKCDRGGFSGCFSDNKINIYYEQGAGHFGLENHKIQGIKTNNR